MSNDTVAHPGPSTQDAQQLLRGDRARIERVLSDCLRMVDAPGPGGDASPAGDSPGSDAGLTSFSPADRSGLLARLGALLGTHLRMKRELLYPALGLASEAVAGLLAEHDSLTARLVALTDPEADPADFSTALAGLVSALGEHLDGEARQLFPAPPSVDATALGAAMAIRRGELLGDQGVD